MSDSLIAYFDDEIGNKGLHLYQEGRVTSIQHQGNSYRAMVVEEKPYHVKITPNPLSMQCDCAFAKQGHHCRHMAAVVAAYEAAHPQTASPESPQDDWRKEIAPYLNQNGRIINGKAFTEAIHHYLAQSVDFTEAKIEPLEACLRLVAYLMKQSTFYYNFDELMIEAMQKAGELRSHLAASEISDADHRCLLCCDRCHDPKLCRSLMDAYLGSGEPESSLLPCIMAHTYENQSIYVNAVFDRLVMDHDHEAELIALCEANGKEPRLRQWMIEYYQKQQQYAKGIRFLERCKADLQAADQADGADVVLFLLLFAIWAKDPALTKRYYPLVLKHPATSKTELFTKMKEAMQEEWAATGRMWMIDALSIMTPQERLAVLAATKSAELLIHELCKMPDTHAFLPYWESIDGYDRGIAYHFIQKELCRQLTADNTLDADFLNLWKKLGKDPANHPSLLHILISCKMIFCDRPSALQTLTQLEELPYE